MAPDRLFSRLQPGDLLFWTGTYNTGRNPNISHVMVYMGKDPQTDEPLMFGARSTKLKGKNGNSVDVYPFKYPKRGGRGTLVGYGRIPEPVHRGLDCSFVIGKHWLDGAGSGQNYTNPNSDPARTNYP